MIAKKSKKANLERKRVAFFQIGLLLAGSMCLLAFEWSSATVEKEMTYLERETFDPILEISPNDNIKIIREEEKKPKTRIVDLNKVKVVDHTVQEGKTIVSDDGKITVDDDYGDEWGTIDMGLEEETGIIYDNAGVMPAFPGGELAMFEWLGKELQYPEHLAAMGVGGYAYIQFVVNTDGSIVDVECLKAPHEDLAKEGIRAVKKMPKWTPGEQAGKKVRVRYQLPIRFRPIH